MNDYKIEYEVREYLCCLLDSAYKRGENELILPYEELHNKLIQLSQKYPRLVVHTGLSEYTQFEWLCPENIKVEPFVITCKNIRNPLFRLLVRRELLGVSKEWVEIFENEYEK